MRPDGYGESRYPLADRPTHCSAAKEGVTALAELVADCPRCGALKTSFDVLAGIPTERTFNRKQHYEVFAVCRHCLLATIFMVSDSASGKDTIDPRGLAEVPGSLSRLVHVDGYVSLKDAAPLAPPEHLPEHIHSAFLEGTTCLAVRCFNASGTMFRLCADLATKALLPDTDIDGLNSQIRRSLGLRMRWLFDTGRLPQALGELSHALREDGNDGAHAGTLTEHDAADLLDFTVALLTRLYTEPERLKAAKARRDARRNDG